LVSGLPWDTCSALRTNDAVPNRNNKEVNSSRWRVLDIESP
jgi:hypothetical protein